MLNFASSPVPVRQDLRDTYLEIWAHFSRPGAVFDAEQRNAVLEAARSGSSGILDDRIVALARALYHNPAAVGGDLVRAVADTHGDATAVETISLVSMLSAVDGAHRALGMDLERLPQPLPGQATGVTATGLVRRRTHVPMPQGAIPMALDLVPSEALAFRFSFAAQYMTDREMGHHDFERSPGLNRAQMELISTRTSLLNECFY